MNHITSFVLVFCSLKNVEVQHGNVEKLPFEDSSIDTVIDTFGKLKNMCFH